MKRFFTALISIFAFLANAAPQLPWDAYVPKREIRAVWLTTLSGLDWPRTLATSPEGIRRQKEELCNILDQLRATNINTILLQTRIRGSVIYPSQIEPWDQCLTGQTDRSPGYDPLKFAIEETHRRGMELHAWVVTIPAFKTEAASRMGRRSLLRTNPKLMRRHNGQYYLDPGLPQTSDYLSALVREIVSRYDIDGIHFDYIRYPEQAASFPDAVTYRKYGRGKSLAQWRRDNITNIVRRIYHEVKALKPWVKMSSSPVGKYRDTRRYSARGWNAYDAVHQDAQGWLREGIQDLLFPMMYFTGDHFYPFAQDWHEGSYGRHIAPGLGIYMLHPREKDWPLSTITREISFLRSEGLQGQAHFRSRFLTDDTKGILTNLRRTSYAFPALPPSYHWLDSIAPSMPTGFTSQISDNQTLTLAWQPSTDNLSTSVRYNVYASRSFPVDTDIAQNLIASLLPLPTFQFNRLTAYLYGLNFAITAIDRCGNESPAAQLGQFK